MGANVKDFSAVESESEILMAPFSAFEVISKFNKDTKKMRLKLIDHNIVEKEKMDKINRNNERQQEPAKDITEKTNEKVQNEYDKKKKNSWFNFFFRRY